MGSIIIQWIVRPIVGVFIGQVAIQILHLLGFYPDKWIAEKFVTAPAEEWVALARWFLAVVIAIAIIVAYESWKRRRNLISETAAETDLNRRYLSDEDSELDTAIHFMARFSAWARWFAAQHLAANEHKPISEWLLIHIASSEVLRAAMNGKLSMRGRPADSIHYEPISRETWRLIWIKMELDPISKWRATIVPRNDVDPERVRQILNYDSIIVSSKEFQQLWPKDDKRYDKARLKELRKAKRLAADPQEIEKLAKGNMAF